MKIYCLPSKLKLLGLYPVTGDGTWSPCRFIKQKQCYILCANIVEGNRCLTVPVLYALCNHFTVRQYNSIFDFAKLKHLEYFGSNLVIKEFHLDCELAVKNSVRLAFPNCVITYCNVHILRSITKHFKKHLGAKFYTQKLFLEMFKTVTGAFYLDFSQKEIVQEFLKILESFPIRAARLNSDFKPKMLKLIKYLKSNYFGYRALFPAKFWNYRSLALTGRFQFSTNAIEALNRALKHFLGMGFINMAKLDSEMNRFHSNKVVESTDGLENGRLNSKRRQTILREKIYMIYW